MSWSPASQRISSRRLRKLLTALEAGQAEALAPLLDLYRPYLLATAHARMNSPLKAKAGPSDLVQETLTEAHRAWQGLEEKPQSEEELRVWLRNILLERLKALQRRYYRAKSRSLQRERSLDDGKSKQLLDQLVAGYDETPGARFEQDAIAERLEEALNRLPTAYRQVILWHSRDGWKFAQIGARMDRSADAARMLWSRALRLLKKELEMRDGDS